ncbi:hypothetical protein LTR85_002108 [Meristemomyces frigidus]|nr:hypothetical protein LTR85_002108 [Meristemomyces frigidus]
MELPNYLTLAKNNEASPTHAAAGADMAAQQEKGRPGAEYADKELLQQLVTPPNVIEPRSDVEVAKAPLLHHLPPEFRFYRAVSDGAMNVNRAFLRTEETKHEWNAFLASVLTEAAAAHHDDISCMGRFLYVPWRVREIGADRVPVSSVGPQVIFVPWVHSPSETKDWLELAPDQRDLTLNAMFATDIPDDQPVLPIYTPPEADLGPRNAAGPLSSSRNVESITDRKSPGLYVDTCLGSHHVLSLRTLFENVETSKTKEGKAELLVARDAQKLPTYKQQDSSYRNAVFMLRHQVQAPDPQLELLRRIVKFWREHVRGHAVPYHDARSYSWHT